ncbi:MAG TPA: outer membrane lipoprotein LolB [Gammaproteobacteria bacterium]|nr:outer membrane lipoprotein LolB [Gammaproteobacteria bacterium]
MLASCVSKPTIKPEQQAWQDRQERYSHLNNWHLKGRLGLRSKQESGAVTLIWNETPDHRQLRLLGPVGHGLVKLEETADGAVLQDSRNTRWQGATSQALIEQATGWNIPVQSLRWWVLGIVEPGRETDYQLDDQSRLASLKQDGWQVSFSQYRYFGGYELPGSIVFQNSTEHPEHSLRGKFLLKKWEPVVK